MKPGVCLSWMQINWQKQGFYFKNQSDIDRWVFLSGNSLFEGRRWCLEGTSALEFIFWVR